MAGKKIHTLLYNQGISFVAPVEMLTMEKRLFGIILIVLGIDALVWTAYNFVQGNAQEGYSVKSLIMYALLSIIFFAAGVGLIKITKDHST